VSRRKESCSVMLSVDKNCVAKKLRPPRHMLEDHPYIEFTPHVHIADLTELFNLCLIVSLQLVRSPMIVRHFGGVHVVDA